MATVKIITDIETNRTRLNVKHNGKHYFETVDLGSNDDLEAIIELLSYHLRQKEAVDSVFPLVSYLDVFLGRDNIPDWFEDTNENLDKLGEFLFEYWKTIHPNIKGVKVIGMRYLDGEPSRVACYTDDNKYKDIFIDLSFAFVLLEQEMDSE